MANLSDKLTDKKLQEMEAHIAEIYSSASADLQKKANEYFESFAVRYEKEHDAYLAGKYTDEEFKMWYLSQVGRGERWQQLKTDMAKMAGKANEIAIDYINGKTPSIFLLNANYTAYEIEKGSGIAFDMVDEETVKALYMDENHSEFRVLKQNAQRDYQWNRTKIQDALLSGILQGEDIGKLAKRFLGVMGANESAAMRNARTAVTSAQNGGRQSTFDKATKMGIDLQKEWISTHDERTRDSHAELDGVRVNNNTKFPNGLRYPGDPQGAPAEVYNCRCTMRAIIPKYNGEPRTDKTVDTYQKWLDEKNSYTAGMGYSTAPIPKDYTISLTREKRKAIIEKGVNNPDTIFALDTDKNKFATVAKNIEEEPGYYNIYMHGNPKNILFFDEYIDAETLGQIILSRSDYKKGTPIKLMSCETGLADSEGLCVAQLLANKINVRVEAPTHKLYCTPYANGKVKVEVGRDDIGHFESFEPIYGME